VLLSGHCEAFGSTEELAATLFRGMRLVVEPDLERIGAAQLMARNVRGVLEVSRTDGHLDVHVEERAVIPTLIDAFTRAGIGIYGAVPRPPSLEDVYFAVLARHEAAA
jgi:hypothetical protein